MTFGNYLESYMSSSPSSSSSSSSSSGYLAQHPLHLQISSLPLPQPLLRYCIPSPLDVSAPPNCSLSTPHLGPILSTWLGADSTTPAHHDPYENWLCQMSGSKRARLHPYEGSARMKPMGGERCNTSSVPFPPFEEEEFWDVRLGAGEALYIPRGWWHYVEGEGAGGSVSMWWGAAMAVERDGEDGEYKLVY